MLQVNLVSNSNHMSLYPIPPTHTPHTLTKLHSYFWSILFQNLIISSLDQKTHTKNQIDLSVSFCDTQRDTHTRITGNTPSRADSFNIKVYTTFRYSIAGIADNCKVIKHTARHLTTTSISEKNELLYISGARKR